MKENADSGRLTKYQTDPPAMVFVPGIMGSRLQIGLEFRWDLDFKYLLQLPLLSTEQRMALFDPTVTQGQVMRDEPWRGHSWGSGPHRRGWFGILQLYEDFLSAMRLEFWDLGAQVWAFGYDWRQDNRTSGAQLADFISQEVLAKAKSCVIVTHSMGGLVTRSMLQQSGLGGKVKAVAHVAQPVDGACDSYQLLTTGPADRYMRLALGDGVRGCMVACGVPAVFQLLPNNEYFRREGQWLRAGFPPRPPAQADIYAVYKMGDAAGVPPVGPPLTEFEVLEDELHSEIEFKAQQTGHPATEAECKETAARLRQQLESIQDANHTAHQRAVTNIGLAKAFHDGLGRNKHSETYSIFTSWHQTVATAHWNDGELTTGTWGGDATVPRFSASALDGGHVQINVDTEHSSLMSNSEIEQVVLDVYNSVL